MADFPANIRINLDDGAALRGLKNLKSKIEDLVDPRTQKALKELVSVQEDRQAFAAQKQERAEDSAYRKRKSRLITDELRLNNALELQESRRVKLQRAGALDVATRRKAVEKLNKVAAANPKDVAIQERVATGLSRILTTQNELNRAENKNVGQKQRIADYNKRIERLRELGVTEGKLRKTLKRRAEFIDASSRRQTTLADRRELQLKRELRTLEDIAKAARTVTRPGSLSGGARSSLGAGPARSELGSPKANEARFKFYENKYKQALANVNRAEQTYEKQLQTNTLNNIKAEETAQLASIDRVAAYERAQNKRTSREAKEERGLGPAKAIGVANQQALGLKTRALAKSIDSTIKKADRVSGKKGATGPLALPDSKTLKRSNKRYSKN